MVGAPRQKLTMIMVPPRGLITQRLMGRGIQRVPMGGWAQLKLYPMRHPQYHIGLPNDI